MAAFVDEAVNGVQLGDGLILGPLKKNCKSAVASIDFGTAYSGTAFALTLAPGTIKCGAPTSLDATQAKVPTALLKLPDDQWHFGNDAETMYDAILMSTPSGETPDANLFKGFKMELKDKNANFETLEVYSSSGNPELLMTLVVKSLDFLKNYATAQVKLASAIDSFNPLTDIQWVLTVPAIWNDFGKAFMRKAAFRAGMMDSEHSDSLILVLEPEGASLAVHVGATHHGLLGTFSRFLVLDCGGGTIDITTHEVTSVEPLTMKAIAPPRGSAWGAEKVNALFREFLQELLGPVLFDENHNLLAFHTIYASFEKIKLVFQPNQTPSNIQLVDVLARKDQLIELAAEWNKAHPDKPILDSPNQRNGFLSMSNQLMLSFFEPSLCSVVEETHAVLNAVEDIQYIVVVGGFGASPVLTKRVRDKFHGNRGVRVILPDPNPKPQAAVVQGAVYFGLHDHLIASRVAAYTYGVAAFHKGNSDGFAILVSKGTELAHDHDVRTSGVPANDAQRVLSWSMYRSDVEEPTTVTGEHFLGNLVVDCPYDSVRENRRQHGVFYFGGSEIRVVVMNAQGDERQGNISMV